MKITLVELPPTQFGILDGDSSSDIYSQFRLPPRALPILTAILKENRWGDVEIIHPQFHGKRGKLTTENWARILASDVLGISAITRTSPQSMTLADEYKRKGGKGIVIAGGMDPTYRTEDWMKHVDIVVRGEAEKTLPILMKRLEKDPKNLEGIDGIAFKKNKEIAIAPKVSLLSIKEFRELPIPYYDEAISRGASVGVVEEERGCSFDCDFCVVSSTYGKIVRYRSPEQVIAEFKQLHDLKLDNRVFLSGDNLAGNHKEARTMLEALIDSGISYGPLTAQISVSAAKDDELLKTMRKARVDALCVGFESINEEALKVMGKPFSGEQNREAAKKFRDYGFWIHGMMITGTDNDTPETLKANVEWAKDNVDSFQLFIATPIPGTRFYDRIEEERRFLTKDLSLCDGYQCVVRPKNFTPYELQTMLAEAYRDFYSLKATVRRIRKTKHPIGISEIWAYAAFSGLNRLINSPQSKAHLKFLKKIS